MNAIVMLLCFFASTYNIIIWNKDTPIQRTDYLCTRENYNKDTTIGNAWSGVEIDIYYDTEDLGDSFKYTIFAYMDKEKSIIFTTTPDSAIEIDRQEFDLYNLRVLMTKYELSKIKDAKQVNIDKIYSEIYEITEKMSPRHCENRKRYSEYIKSKIQEYEMFQKNDIVIKK